MTHLTIRVDTFFTSLGLLCLIALAAVPKGLSEGEFPTEKARKTEIFPFFKELNKNRSC